MNGLEGFLKIPGTVYPNLAPNKEGVVSLPFFNTSAYQTLEIVVMDE